MSLSEQELNTLREIEQSLLADDPTFGSGVTDDHVFGSGEGINLSLQGVALIVVGLVAMLMGVILSQNSLWFIALSVVGFLVMFGAGVWMLRGGGKQNRRSRRRPSMSLSMDKAGPIVTKDGGSLSSRMEENFRRRFEER